MRLFENYPNLEQQLYPFRAAYLFGPERQMTRDQASNEDLSQVTYQNALDVMENFITETESKGKIPMIKDHCLNTMSSKTIARHLNHPRRILPEPILIDKRLDEGHPSNATNTSPTAKRINNPTVLPDRLLLTLTPIFTIRHPFRQMTSYMKAARPSISVGATALDDDFPVETSFKWTRLLFDAYKDINGIPPIVVDGDDLINDTRGRMKKICERLGLEESLIKYEWESRECPPWGEGNKLFMEKAQSSTRIIRDESLLNPPGLEEESKLWMTMWGKEEAEKMKELALEALVDYKYLKSFSV